MKKLVVAPCNLKAAKYAVTKWHYSRTMPVGKLISYGVWENEKFIGCVIYSWGANKNLSSQFDLQMIECVELVRVALSEHQCHVSQVVSITLKKLKQSNPGLRLVVSFADPYRNHYGGIYQAGNWIFSGTTNEKIEFVLPNGTVLNRRAYTGQQFGRGEKSKAKIPRNAKPKKMPGKLRYLYPLDKAMRRQVDKLAIPYPRGSSIKGDAPSVLLGGQGSIPWNRSISNLSSNA